MTNTDIRPSAHALTGILADIARITSIEHALAMAREYGGRRVYIPLESRVRADHPLAKLIGVRATRLIGRRFGGERYDVPSAKAYLHWYDARRLKADGYSNAQISRAIGISLGRVGRLLEGFEAPASVGKDRASAPKVCAVCGRKHRDAGRHAGLDPRQLTLL